MKSTGLSFDSAPPRASRSAGPARFTLDGDDALEAHLARVCERVLSGVRGLIPERRLDAVLLGGGYGRGEGGVLREAEGDRPYNDMEFYVAVRGNRHLNELLYRRPLAVLGDILSHLAGVEVEFKIASLAEWRAHPVSMFSYDLFAGHRLLWGDEGVLEGCAHHLQSALIPLSEAARLLMNRGTGLLLARARLSAARFSCEDADFVRRNIAKAELACGDAMLTARGLYHWSCRERHHILEHIEHPAPWPWHDTLIRHHAAGVAFKLHPDDVPLPREALAERHAEVARLACECWRWIEGQRLGRPFASVRAYARDPADKCRDGDPFRNLLRNLCADGGRPRLSPRPWRHPRQRIFHSLALLLWEPDATVDSEALTQLQRELNTRAASFDGLVSAYENLWRRVR
jgi:hypothetical protein